MCVSVYVKLLWQISKHFFPAPLKIASNREVNTESLQDLVPSKKEIKPEKFVSIGKYSLPCYLLFASREL